jgi:hypothetical protein
MRRMTELQRRGRRELVILLTFMATLFVPGSLWDIWQARHDWGQLGSAFEQLVTVLTILVGVWRGTRSSRRIVIAVLGIVSVLMLWVGIGAGRQLIDYSAFLKKLEGVGFHPLVAYYSWAAVNLVAAFALAYSAPIHAYWDSRRDPKGKTASDKPPDVVSGPPLSCGEPSLPEGDRCLACGALLPEDVERCAACGWTFTEVSPVGSGVAQEPRDRLDKRTNP